MLHYRNRERVNVPLGRNFCEELCRTLTDAQRECLHQVLSVDAVHAKTKHFDTCKISEVCRCFLANFVLPPVAIYKRAFYQATKQSEVFFGRTTQYLGDTHFIGRSIHLK